MTKEFESAARTSYNTFDNSVPDLARKKIYLKRNILPRIQERLPTTSHLVEIGPGHGTLLELLRAQGYQNLSAFEVCETYANSLSNRGFSVKTGISAAEFLKSLPTGSLDAILLIDVIEHLDSAEVFELMRAACDALKNTGICIVQTPNASGLFGMNTFVADPTHCTPYNEIRLERLFAASGFSSAKCFPMRLGDSLSDNTRTALRSLIFAAARLLTRICAATPIRILTHNLIAVAER